MTEREITSKVLANARTYTKSYLDAMPEIGYDFKPLPEVRTFAQQMLHLADATYYFICIASGKPSPLGQISAEQTIAPTKEAVTMTVMESYDFFANAVEGIVNGKLQEMVKIGDLKLPKMALVIKAYEHQAHHRGQTTIYLRYQGVIPPDGMIF